jgi:hypothetical protein
MSTHATASPVQRPVVHVRFSVHDDMERTCDRCAGYGTVLTNSTPPFNEVDCPSCVVAR